VFCSHNLTPFDKLFKLFGIINRITERLHSYQSPHFLKLVITLLSLLAFSCLLLLHSHGIILVLRLLILYASYSVCIFLSFLIYLIHDILLNFNKIKLFRFFLKFPTNHNLRHYLVLVCFHEQEDNKLFVGQKLLHY
jgi:hypothetical protein